MEFIQFSRRLRVSRSGRAERLRVFANKRRNQGNVVPKKGNEKGTDSEG